MEPEDTSQRWVRLSMGLLLKKKKKKEFRKTSYRVLMLQFYQAVCLRRCQAFQYAGEHPGTSQALWLWCQHAGMLICLCEHDRERMEERERERGRKTIVYSCITTGWCNLCVSVCMHMVNLSITAFIFNSKHQWGPKSLPLTLTPPPHLHCSAASKKSLVIIMTHTHNSKASLICIQ